MMVRFAIGGTEYEGEKRVFAPGDLVLTPDGKFHKVQRWERGKSHPITMLPILEDAAETDVTVEEQLKAAAEAGVSVFRVKIA